MGRWLFVAFVLWIRVTAAISPLFPAEIVSPHGSGPLHFKVGTDVTLQCRLNSSHVTAYDVSKMTLYRASSNETFNVTVIDDATVQVTLRNVTLVTNEVVFCRVEPNATLAMTSLCIGYAPSDDFNVTCRLRPYVSLQCCVISEQRQDTLCNVTWSMSYRTRRRDWRTFPGQGVDAGSLCATWLLSSGSRPRLSYTSKLTVRARAHSHIGRAENTLTFRPIRYAVPEPVLSLAVWADQTEAHALQVTWQRNETIDDWICEEMELAYVIIATPIHYDDSVTETRTVNVTDKCTDDQEMHAAIKGLNPFMEYNVSVIPRGLHFTGSARSRLAKTAQSSPLKAPSIVGWSRSSLSPHRVAVYWKKFLHHEMGGPIVSYEVKVTGSEVEAEAQSETEPTLRFNVSQEKMAEEDDGAGQLVAAPRAMPGCPGRCVVSLTASTQAGTSPAAAVSIIPPPKDKANIVVHTERASNESRIVSWEGDADVTSVLWCFGPRYSEDASLINCQTELQEKAVGPGELAKRQVLIGAEELHGDDMVKEINREWTRRCENCQWHFTLGVPTPADRRAHHDVSADDADADTSSSDSDVTAAASSPAAGFGSGADTGRRLVWNRPLADILEGSSRTESHTLVVPVTVALTLAVILPLCIACLVWCVRRYRAKAKHFSKLDFPAVRIMDSRNNPRRKKSEIFATSPSSTTKMAPQLNTEVLQVNSSATQDPSSELDWLFGAQDFSAFESCTEERFRGTDPLDKSSPPETNTRTVTSAATAAGYVTTTFAVRSGDQSEDSYDEGRHKDSCRVGDCIKDSVGDHNRDSCNRERSNDSCIGDHDRDSRSIGDHITDCSVEDRVEDSCNRENNKDRYDGVHDRESCVGNRNKDSHNEHRTKDCPIVNRNYVGDRNKASYVRDHNRDSFSNGEHSKDIYLESDLLPVDAESVCLLTDLNRKNLADFLQTSAREVRPEYCPHNSEYDFRTGKVENFQSLGEPAYADHLKFFPSNPVEGTDHDDFCRTFREEPDLKVGSKHSGSDGFFRTTAEGGEVSKSRGGATDPSPPPEEAFPFMKEGTARSLSSDSGNCTDYTERPEEGEGEAEGEGGGEEEVKEATAREIIHPPVSLLRTGYTQVAPI